MNAEDCNEYRAKYAEMTKEEKVAWHSRLWREHRAQSHFCLDAVREFFGAIPGDVSVIELGGWDGELAQRILGSNSDILLWENNEICTEARENSVCSDKRYILSDSRETYLGADVVVASHVLEHLLPSEVEYLLDDYLRYAKYLYVDAPNPHEVDDSTSFHLIGDIWPVLSPMLEGWTEDGRMDTARWFSK